MYPGIRPILKSKNISQNIILTQLLIVDQCFIFSLIGGIFLVDYVQGGVGLPAIWGDRSLYSIFFIEE